MRFRVPVFAVKNLSLTIDGEEIVSHVTMQLMQGEYAALIGPNGGGKTTLVRMILGLQKPTKGEIQLFGQPKKRFKAWHKIGYVPQRVSQVDTAFPATVLEVIRMGRIAKQGFFHRENAEDLASVEDAMQKMEVSHLRDRLIGTLSGGQRQRVMIARALASHPEVLILDEPNTGVDAVSQERFYQLLRELNQNEGISILFITHDVGVIADDISRLFTINQHLVSCDNPKDALSCSEMSKLYHTEAHLLSQHHQHEWRGSPS